MKITEMAQLVKAFVSDKCNNQKSYFRLKEFFQIKDDHSLLHLKSQDQNLDDTDRELMAECRITIEDSQDLVRYFHITEVIIVNDLSINHLDAADIMEVAEVVVLVATWIGEEVVASHQCK
jgi:hypothetical protein